MEAQLIMTAPTNSDAPLLLTVEEASLRMNIGRTLMYSLVRSGAVRSVKVGGRLRRVPTEALTEYIAAQFVGDARSNAAAA
jgi:excisionase family DNA binding protein